MDPRERLRMALLGSGCARCGRPYAAQGINVLAQRDEIAFVQLICFSCQVQTLALITGIDALRADAPDAAASNLDADADGAHLDGDGNGNGSGRRATPAITDDDVLEMHTFLSAYEGDIKTLLDGDASGGGDEGSAG